MYSLAEEAGEHACWLFPNEDVRDLRQIKSVLN